MLKLTTDKQTDKQTNRQDKNNMPPIIRSGGIKINALKSGKDVYLSVKRFISDILHKRKTLIKTCTVP